VFYLSLYIAESGIRTGPLFPRLTRGKNPKITIAYSYWVDPNVHIKWWKDIDGNVVNMSYDILNRMFAKLFDKAGYGQADMYSIRKSATKWAARCGAEQWQIVKAGRWEEWSKHFLSYIQAGCLDGQNASDDPEDDPIRKMWVFYPTAVQSSVQRENVVRD
jgi:hypothetical protein